MKTIIIDGVEYNLTPKAVFHEGDWVIDKQGIVHQIANVVENVTNHTYGYDVVGGGYFNDTVEGVRLWNISDAKNGDILHSTGFHNDCIFIFNGLDNWKFDDPNGDRAVATGYCCLSVSADNMEFGMQGPDCVEVNTVKPATKIQRDTLLKAMSDAGYTFDFDKKELKKIEDEECDGEDYGIAGLWHAKNILEKTLGKVDGYQTDDGIIDHKCAISAVDKLYKQKPAEWSEEDKHWIQKVIDFMNHPDLIKATPTLAKDTINWLKSLKDRVQPQSKQEWSEEDESNFQGIIDEIEANKHSAPDCDLATYDKFLSWLKSFKPLNRWKPSDVQIEALEHFIRSIGERGHASPYENNTKLLYSLLEQLKKIREE